MAKEEGVFIDATRRFEDKKFLDRMFQAEDDLVLQAEAARVGEIYKTEIEPAGRERFLAKIEADRKVVPFKPRNNPLR